MVGLAESRCVCDWAEFDSRDRLTSDGWNAAEIRHTTIGRTLADMHDYCLHTACWLPRCGAQGTPSHSRETSGETGDCNGQANNGSVVDTHPEFVFSIN